MSERAIAVKNQKVDEFKQQFGRASVMVIADYLGFTVKEMTDLRKKLRQEDSEFKVIKNTLIERTLEKVGLPAMDDHLKGSTAVLLGYRDAITPLKVLVKFIKEAEKGKIRVGVVDGKVISQGDLIEMSKLPSREVLLAKALGGLKSPLYGLVNVLQGPIRKLVYALDAIKNKKGGE